MTYNPALAYRQEAVRTASPLGLVVLLYDSLLLSLNRAVHAFDSRQIELRVTELNRALKVIDTLQGTLDFEKGGDIAANLDRLYEACRGAILGANISQKKDAIVRIAGELRGVRDAWRDADRKSSLEEGALAGAENWTA
jgi:flagellar protein FliS